MGRPGVGGRRSSSEGALAPELVETPAARALASGAGCPRARRHRQRLPRPRRPARDRGGHGRDRHQHLWCQFGVINEEGNRIAEEGGVSVVVDRCLKIEHARYVGRTHRLGFNTQRITSVRTGLQ
ncbi:CoA-binding protein [Nocardioides endophyticus]|uniref:CoA-binding protein n=1 Tax=Nocardioides endophyticus TaxID=1353775 RepID=UPI003CD09D49